MIKYTKQKNKKSISIFKIFIVFFLILGSATGGFFANEFLTKESPQLISPFISTQESKNFPLLKYSIKNLRNRKYNSSNIVIKKLISKEDKYNAYLFSYTTLGKKMTGQINIPNNITASPLQKHSAIVMIRGYVPIKIYKTGVGTKNAASVLAQNGYITLAPDFFGYGDSGPEPDDTWQTRFEKPIVIIELIKSLKEKGVPADINIKDDAINTSKLAKNKQKIKTYKIDNLGIWAHSNGGQIALTTLEILNQKIPTTLWAPVTAPFPYSILYFGDELEDEGKSQRKWISMFEEKYDVFDFSLTKHLNLLQGPIQIQHGANDDAALIYWSREFMDKIKLENSRRGKIISTNSDSSTDSNSDSRTNSHTNANANSDSRTNSNETSKDIPSNTNEKNANDYDNKNSQDDSLKTSKPVVSTEPTKPIEIKLYEYQNTNHNMIPNWNKAINKDLKFFNNYL